MRTLKWISYLFAILTLCGGLYEILGARPWNPVFWILPMILSHVFNHLSKRIEKRNMSNND